MVLAKPRPLDPEGHDGLDFLDEQTGAILLTFMDFVSSDELARTEAKQSQKEGGEDREKGAHGEKTPDSTTILI